MNFIKSLIAVSVLFFITSNALGQNYEKIDSLKGACFHARLSTDFARYLLYIGYEFEGWENDSAIHYYELGIQYSKYVDSKAYEAKFYNYLGLTYFFYSLEYEKAISSYEAGLEVCTEMNDLDGIGRELNNIGLVYLHLNEYDTALEFFQEAISIYVSIDDIESCGFTFSNIGAVYNQQSLYIKAAKYFYYALEIGDNFKNIALINKANANLAVIYIRQGRYDIALKHQNRMLEFMKKEENIRGIADCYHNLGVIYEYTERQDSSQILYEKAIEIYDSVNDQFSVANIKSDLGNLHVSRGDYKTAAFFYTESLNLFHQTQNKEKMALVLNNLGLLHIAERNFHKAILVLNEGLGFVKEIGDIDREQLIYRNLTTAYFGSKNFDEGVFYNDLAISLKDSVLGINEAKAIAEIETKYQTEKKEKQILALSLAKETISKEKLQEEQKTRTTIFVTSGILGLIIVLFIIVRLRSKNREVRLQSDFRNLLLEQSNRLNEGKQIERDRIAAELHDGIGSQVNGVYMHLDRLTESEQSAQYKYVLELQKIGTRIRNLSHQLNDTQSANKQHLSQLIEDLCTLHQANNFKVDFQSNNSIENLEFSQLAVIQIYTIIQESLNNTMKHAKATRVTIDMTSENDQLSLSIADNGKGMGENQSDGFGLKSIKKRIKSLRGKLEILGADGVFLKIQFPLKTVVEA